MIEPGREIERGGIEDQRGSCAFEEDEYATDPYEVRLTITDWRSIRSDIAWKTWNHWS